MVFCVCEVTSTTDLSNCGISVHKKPNFSKLFEDDPVVMRQLWHKYDETDTESEGETTTSGADPTTSESE